MEYYYELDAVDGNEWNIYDTYKNYICSVYTKNEAEKLLLHLNKENSTGIKTMEEAYNVLKYNLNKASNTLDADLCIKYTQAALNAAQAIAILNNLQRKKQEHVDPYLQTR